MAERSKLQLQLDSATQEVTILRLQQDVTRLTAHYEAEADKVKRLTIERDAADASWKNAAAERDKARGEAREAIKQRDDTLAEFSELKARLFAAETENHRLHGYIDRIREDDSVRDGVQIITDEMPRTVPRRVPAPEIHTPMRAYQHFADCAARSTTATEVIERDRSRHWTSYGDRR